MATALYQCGRTSETRSQLLMTHLQRALRTKESESTVEAVRAANAELSLDGGSAGVGRVVPEPRVTEVSRWNLVGPVSGRHANHADAFTVRCVVTACLNLAELRGERNWS